MTIKMKFFLNLIILIGASTSCFSQEIAAPARTENGWGYMKPDLTWIVHPQFYAFWRDNVYVFSDNENRSILCEFHERMARCRTKDRRWGFLNTEGAFAIKDTFVDARHFSGSLAG